MPVDAQLNILNSRMGVKKSKTSKSGSQDSLRPKRKPNAEKKRKGRVGPRSEPMSQLMREAGLGAEANDARPIGELLQNGSENTLMRQIQEGKPPKQSPLQSPKQPPQKRPTEPEERREPEAIEEEIDATKTFGQPLDDETRGDMESAFGQDLGEVRVHTDEKAATLNTQLQAKAFTHEQDIYFGEDEYDPQSTEGRKLLAHELTHTLQQAGDNRVQRQETPEAESDAPASVPPGDVEVREQDTSTGEPVDRSENPREGEELPEMPAEQPAEAPQSGPKEDPAAAYESKLEEIYSRDPGADVSLPETETHSEENERISSSMDGAANKEPPPLQGDQFSEEFLAFRAQVLLKRQVLIEHGETVRDRIGKRNDAEKKNIRKGLETAEANLKSGHETRVQRVRDAVETETSRVLEAKTTQLEAIEVAASYELIALEVERDVQKAALRTKAKTQADAAQRSADGVVRDIHSAVEKETAEMLFIAIKKGRQYKDYNRAERIKAMALEKAQQRGEELQDIISQLDDVQEPLSKLSTQILDDAEANAGKFDEAYEEGVKEINRQKGELREAVTAAADDAVRQIEDNGRLFIEGLEAQHKGDTQGVDKILQLLETQLDNQALRAQQHVEGQTQIALEKIDGFLEDAAREAGDAEGEVAGAIFGEAERELMTMIDAFNAEVIILAEGADSALGETSGEAADHADGQVSKAGSGIDGATDTLISNLTRTAQQTIDQMGLVVTKGQEDLKYVTAVYKEKSEESVAALEQGWIKTVADTRLKIDQKVRPVIAEIRKKSNGLAAEIDKEAERIENENLFERFISFTKGAFVGFFEAIWDLLRFIFEDLWVAILIVVGIVALIIIAAKSAWAALAILAVGIAFALVLGAIHLYQAFSREDLSDTDRGKFLGRALFEALLILIPARHLRPIQLIKILRRVKGLKNADPVRTSRLIRAMGNSKDTERLLRLTKDVILAEKLWKHFKNVDEIEAFIASFKSHEAFLKAMAFYKDPGLILRARAAVGAENFDDLYYIPTFKKAPIGEMDRFFRLTEGASADQILATLGHQKLRNLGKINVILGHKSKAPASLEVFLRALKETKFKEDAWIKTLNSKLITDFDEAARVGAIIKPRSKFYGEDLATLLNHSLVKNLPDLEWVLNCDKIRGGSQQIIDSLHTGKLQDIGELRYFLNRSEVESMADLVTILQSSVLRDSAQLRAVVNHPQVKSLKQFQKLIDKGVITSYNKLDDVLNNGQLKALLESIDAAEHIPWISRGFADWFDALSADRLRELMLNKANRDTIGDRIRNPGGMHEWIMVSMTPRAKEWNPPVTIQQIWDLRTPTGDIRLSPNKYKPPLNHDSNKMHQHLAALIDRSTSLDDFRNILRNWAKDALEGGIDDLPDGFQ